MFSRDSSTIRALSLTSPPCLSCASRQAASGERSNRAGGDSTDRVFHALADPPRPVIVERLSRVPASGQRPPDRTFAVWSDGQARASWYNVRSGLAASTSADSSVTRECCLTAADTPARRSSGTSSRTSACLHLRHAPARDPHHGLCRHSRVQARTRRHSLVFTEQAPTVTATRSPPTASTAWAACWTRSDRGSRSADPAPAERSTRRPRRASGDARKRGQQGSAIRGGVSTRPRGGA